MLHCSGWAMRSCSRCGRTGSSRLENQPCRAGDAVVGAHRPIIQAAHARMLAAPADRKHPLTAVRGCGMR
eukprot:10011371-Alexandrium_andersonii.AAC.2